MGAADGVQAVQLRIAQIEQRIAGASAPEVRPGAAFGAVLADAIGAAGRVRGLYGAGRVGAAAPPGLAGFENGRVPVDALTPIGQGGHRLWGPAAAAFERMAADAAAAGVPLRVTDSYRSFGAQVDVAARKGLYRNGGLAAVPGTSDHGWGLSVDVDAGPVVLDWLRRRAGHYGFVEDVPREPWHWTFQVA